MTTPNTPAGGAVACPHCGAPCRTEVLMRGGDNGWGDDASRTVYRCIPSTVSTDQVRALVEKWRERAAEMDDICDIDGSIVTGDCADELAQLIGDNK